MVPIAKFYLLLYNQHTNIKLECMQNHHTVDRCCDKQNTNEIQQKQTNKQTNKENRQNITLNLLFSQIFNFIHNITLLQTGIDNIMYKFDKNCKYSLKFHCLRLFLIVYVLILID